MYGLPLNTDLDYLLGQKLIQACFGSNDLILAFDETQPVKITITSSISCSTPAAMGKQTEDFSSQASFILHLLDVPVEGFSILPAGTLQLSFQNGSKLCLFDDSDQFESYVIEHRGKCLIV